MRIIEWNINQRSNFGGKDFIPSWVSQEINEREADIVIITEFKKVTGWEEFIRNLDLYNPFISENGNNEVLIAISKKFKILNGSEHSWTSNYDDNKPDYMEVSIEHDRKIITIIGARILVNRYNYNCPEEVTREMKHRHLQWKKILDRVTMLNHKGNLVIGAGDFNTGRRKNQNEDWSMNVMKKELFPMFNLYTPTGYSHELYKGDEYAGCPDNVFASGCIQVETTPFYWNFVVRDKTVYFEGKLTKKIPNPYPDHAIIIADLDL